MLLPSITSLREAAKLGSIVTDLSLFLAIILSWIALSIFAEHYAASISDVKQSEYNIRAKIVRHGNGNTLNTGMHAYS